MKSRNLIIKSIKVDKNNRQLQRDGSVAIRKPTQENQSPAFPSSGQLYDGDNVDDDCSSVSSIEEDVNAMNIWDNSELQLRGVDVDSFSDFYGKKLSFLQLFKLRSSFYSKSRVPTSSEVFKGAEKIFKFCSSRITLEEYQEDDRMRNIVDLNLAKDRNAIQFVRFFDNHIDSNLSKNRQPQYDRYAAKSSHHHDDLASPSPLIHRKKFQNQADTPTNQNGFSPRKPIPDYSSQRKSQLNLEQLNEIHRIQRNQMQQNHWTLREDASPEPKKSNLSFQFTEIEETEQTQYGEDPKEREIASKFRTLNLSRVQSKDKINASGNSSQASKGISETQVGRQTLSRNGSQLGIGQQNNVQVIKSSPVKIQQQQFQQTTDKFKGYSTSQSVQSENPAEFKLRLKVAHSEITQDSNSPTTASPGGNYTKSNATPVTTTTTTNEQLRQSLVGQIKKTTPAQGIKPEAINPSANFQKFLSTNTSPWKRGNQQPPTTAMTQSVNNNNNNNNNMGQKYSESTSPTRPVIRQGRLIQSSMINSAALQQDVKLPNIAAGRTKNSQSIISDQVTRSPMKQSKIFHQNSMGQTGQSSQVGNQPNMRSEVFTRSRKHNYSAFTSSGTNAEEIFKERVQIPSKP